MTLPSFTRSSPPNTSSAAIAPPTPSADESSGRAAQPAPTSLQAGLPWEWLLCCLLTDSIYLARWHAAATCLQSMVTHCVTTTLDRGQPWRRNLNLRL
ncbi:hypothetical protein NL676_008704 [Syzygium grande]|nr:hypothetical protein NL676_008704 [Syzygium grande]